MMTVASPVASASPVRATAAAVLAGAVITAPLTRAICAIAAMIAPMMRSICVAMMRPRAPMHDDRLALGSMVAMRAPSHRFVVMPVDHDRPSLRSGHDHLSHLVVLMRTMVDHLVVVVVLMGAVVDHLAVVGHHGPVVRLLLFDHHPRDRQRDHDPGRLGEGRAADEQAEGEGEQGERGLHDLLHRNLQEVCGVS